MQPGDEQLAAAALKKRANGQPLSRSEEAALRRVQKARDEQLQQRHVECVPKKLYLRLAGRPAKVVLEQADRYGLPLRGETVNLFEAIRAFHDLLAKYARVIATANAGADDQDSPALERYREEKFRLAQLDRLEREGQLLPREVVHERFGRVAFVLRRAGEILARKFGPEAHAVLSEALNEAIREVCALGGIDNDDARPDEFRNAVVPPDGPQPAA